MFAVTAEEMRTLDRDTIEEVGVPGVVLMENAGRGAVCVLSQTFPDLESRRIAVISGTGNNGGDGFVIARGLIQRGVTVDVYLAGGRDQVSGDAKLSLEILHKLGVSIHEVGTESGCMPIEIPWASYTLIIDALLGTGLHSEVRGLYKELIEAINRTDAPVMDVDIPSGLCSDRGLPLGVAVEAQVTATFGLPKIGQFLYPGRTHCGELWVIDIGIPHQIVEKRSIHCTVVTPEDLKRAIPPRSREAHKGGFGHLLVIAGSAGKTGAGALASEAALRVGAGLVTLGLPQSLNLAMEARLTEVMTLSLPETPHQSLSKEAAGEIMSALDGKTCVALGPGVSTLGDTPELVRELVQRVPLPMVIDADGLNALCGHLKVLKEVSAPRILTPHPGEMGRLLNRGVQEIQRDRIGSALDLARKTGAYVLLKGAGTVVANPQGEVGLIATGNPAMASAGMGDILTGVVAGLLCQRMAPFEAMKLGAYLHGWVADHWAGDFGERGLVAKDLLTRIPTDLEKILRGDVPRVWPRGTERCFFHA
jgi:NAD(P)H-hydrate epimerase